MIRIPSDPAMEAKLRQAIAENLRNRRHGRKHLAHEVEDVRRAAASLTRQERVAFGLLHYQFVKAPVPGLASVVHLGRFLVRSWNRIRSLV